MKWRSTGGIYYTHDPPTIESHSASAPVLPHYIILKKNLRDGLDLIDRTGYTT